MNRRRRKRQGESMIMMMIKVWGKTRRNETGRKMMQRHLAAARNTRGRDRWDT
jgi:hypothetical protein